MRSAIVAALALLLATAACTNEDAVLGVTVPPPMGTPVSLSKDVQPIFTRSCVTGCHSGSAPFAGMSLEQGKTYGSVVGVAACEAPQLKRVDPGDSATSYLVLKLQGDQSSVGTCASCAADPTMSTTCGVRMPFGGSPLSDIEIGLIRDWIDHGALDD